MIARNIIRDSNNSINNSSVQNFNNEINVYASEGMDTQKN